MNMRTAWLVLVVALLLLANCAAATRCMIFVEDEYKMTINNADIYLDDWSHLLGTTSYNTAIGRNCWVGNIPEGQHVLYAKWAGVPRSRPSHEGSASVNLEGRSPQRITIVTHRV